MKLTKVSCYQAVEIPTIDKKQNINTISAEIIPGVELELLDHLVKVSHKDWDEDVYVATSNVRYCTTKKMVKTFDKSPLIVNKETIKIEDFVKQEPKEKLKKTKKK